MPWLWMFSVHAVFSADIVDFMKKQVGDPSTLKEKISDVKNAMLKEDVTIVGFFKGEEDTVYKTYQTACTYELTLWSLDIGSMLIFVEMKNILHIK